MKKEEAILSLVNACLSETGSPPVGFCPGTYEFQPCPFCGSLNTQKGESHSGVFFFGNGDPGVRVFGANCNAGAKSYNAISLIEYFFGPFDSPAKKMAKLEALCAKNNIQRALLLSECPEPILFPAKSFSRSLDPVLSACEDKQTEGQIFRLQLGIGTIFTGGVSDTKNGEMLDILSFLRSVKDGTWKDAVLAVREEQDPVNRRALKNQLPTFCPAGIYTERNEKNRGTNSGFICLDWDESKRLNLWEIRHKLSLSPYVVGAFSSAGGKGFKALVRVDEGLDSKTANALAINLFSLWGWEIDDAAPAWTQVSSDEDAYISGKEIHEIPVLTPRRFACEFLTDGYFYAGNGRYPLARGMDLSFTELIQNLRSKRREFLEEHKEFEKVLPQVDDLGTFIREEKAVSVAYPSLAGRLSGIQFLGKQRILVQDRNPIELVEPVKGEFPFIDELLDLVLEDPNQKKYFLLWLKHALDALFDSLRTYGAIIRKSVFLAILGESGAGKNLLLSAIITPVLGGREVKGDFLADKNARFKGALIHGEVVYMDDIPELSLADRNRYTQVLKGLVSGNGFVAEKKFGEPVDFSGAQVVVQLLNAEQDGNRVNSLPLFTGDAKDKFSCLYVKNAEAVKKKFPSVLRGETEKRIKAELPAFVFFLLFELEVPEELRDDRFGVKTYLHPYAESILLDASPENQLLDRIFELRSFPFGEPVNAGTVCRYLELPPSSASTIGKHLTSLAKSRPELVRKSTGASNNKEYTITKRSG